MEYVGVMRALILLVFFAACSSGGLLVIDDAGLGCPQNLTTGVPASTAPCDAGADG